MCQLGFGTSTWGVGVEYFGTVQVVWGCTGRAVGVKGFRGNKGFRDGETLDKIKEKGDECIFVRGETSSRHVDSSNMHTFYQHHPSEHHWTKDHPLEQVIGNPSQSVRTRGQLESDGEMCMFTLT
nr:integrase, catalytic region, zinc finger, CCHC-type, peptidase aspartic, catalytic [Tanacetum cinerariifolium]